MTALNIFGLVAMVLAVTGVLCNNRKLIACFPIFLCSNVITLVLHLQVGLWSVVIRDGIFIVLGVEGWMKWRKMARKQGVANADTKTIG